jgi:hypothetical protein
MRPKFEEIKEISDLWGYGSITDRLSLPSRPPKVRYEPQFHIADKETIQPSRQSRGAYGQRRYNALEVQPVSGPLGRGWLESGLSSAWPVMELRNRGITRPYQSASDTPFHNTG